MANRCYCGLSAAYPWCDGSHARAGADADEEAPETPAAATAKALEVEPSRRPPGLLARLFGFRGPKS